MARTQRSRRLRHMCNAVATRRGWPHAAEATQETQLSAHDLLAHDRAGAVLSREPALRNMPYLAESESTGIPRTLSPCTPDLPMVWCPRPGASTDVATAGTALRKLIDRELAGAGALLIRNLQSFGVSDAKDFSQLTASLGYDLFECVTVARLPAFPVPPRLRWTDR
jgi:hypothetical protein